MRRRSSLIKTTNPHTCGASAWTGSTPKLPVPDFRIATQRRTRMCERMRWLVQILVVGITACFIQTQSFAVEFRSASGYAVGSSPQSVVVGDFNGDGKMDLAVLNTVSNNVSILLGNGDGTFQAAKNFDAGSNPSGIFLGDFNGD